MTENAVTAESAPAPADLSDADQTAQRLIKALQVMLRDLTGWRVWASDSGALYATRDTDLSAHELAAGLEMTLSDEDPRELLAKIKADIRKTAKYAADRTERQPSRF